MRIEAVELKGLLEADRDALLLVALELDRARQLFPPFRSPHEGYAVILEELDELWAEVRAKKNDYRRQAEAREAVQVAAMAVKFLSDLCDSYIDTPPPPPR